MRTRARLLLGLSAVVALGVTLGLVVAFASAAPAKAQHYRWDLISLNSTTLTISPGGHASAFATGSGGITHTGEITITGSGTFRSNSGSSQNVTGGGTWQTFDAAGNPNGSGTYEVTGFVDFELAPGFLPPALTDTIGPNPHSGLAVLRIAYSDGSDGTLTVSCDLPGGSPPTLFEGITATKGYIDYWERDPAVGGVDANRTQFHQIH